MTRFLVFALLVTRFTGPLHAQSRSSADSVRLVTSDIPRFWAAFDRPVTELEPAFRDYLAYGSPGLRAFAPREIGSAFSVAKQVYEQRARFDSVRDATLRASEAEPAIREALRKLAELYPQTVFVDVYFVVGRFVVGGWTRGDTMVVATEMYPGPRVLPWIVAHELVHRQQRPAAAGQTLLERAFNEGSADFIGELVSGGTINPAAQQYGRVHERELWTEFKGAMRGTVYAPWLYTPVNGRPADLGYFFGYRIAEAYYNHAADKQAAVREIILAKDIDAILAASGYEP